MARSVQALLGLCWRQGGVSPALQELPSRETVEGRPKHKGNMDLSSHAVPPSWVTLGKVLTLFSFSVLFCEMG